MSPQGSRAEVEKESQLQKEMAFKRALEEESRVLNIAYPILKANAELCESSMYSAGVHFWNSYAIQKEYKDIAASLYGVDDSLKVAKIVKSSPAEKVGLKSGDMIMAVNGTAIPSGRNAVQFVTKAFDNVEGKDIEISYERNGKQETKTVSRVPVCKYGVVYNADDTSVNAYADGNNIIIPRGMLRFIDNDTELALVISHELAHNAMGHMSKKKQNAVGAGLAGFAFEVLIAAAGGTPDGSVTQSAMNAGAQAYSVEFEQEADYVGMYFMERAGYKTDGVANFWRRMASELDDKAIQNRGSHPTAPERFVAIEKTHQEIQDKKKKGLTLKPEIKEEPRVQVTNGSKSGMNN